MLRQSSNDSQATQHTNDEDLTHIQPPSPDPENSSTSNQNDGEGSENGEYASVKGLLKWPYKPTELIMSRVYVTFQFLILISLVIFMTTAYVPELREPFGPRLNITNLANSTVSKFPVHRSYYEFDAETRQVTRPLLSQRILTWICVALFTLDLIARGIFCPQMWPWIRSIYTITDIISLLPFYVEGVIISFIEALPTSPESDELVKHYMFIIDIFNIFKVFVIARIFRLLQRQRSTRVLMYTIRTAATNISMILELMLLCAILFGTCIFFFDEGIGSIFIGIWWAFTTMTTVGYGDIAPETVPGRFIAVICMIIGILLTSYTIPILVNDFLLFYGHADQLAWMRKVHKAAQEKRIREKRNMQKKKKIKLVRDILRNMVVGTMQTVTTDRRYAQESDKNLNSAINSDYEDERKTVG